MASMRVTCTSSTFMTGRVVANLIVVDFVLCGGADHFADGQIVEIDDDVLATREMTVDLDNPLFRTSLSFSSVGDNPERDDR